MQNCLTWGGGYHYNKDEQNWGRLQKKTFEIIEFADNFGAKYRVCR